MQARSEDQRELLDAESVVGHLTKPGSVFAFLAEHRRQLFPDAMFADLFPSQRGRPSVPAEVMASVIVLQTLHGMSDSETTDAITFDLRWKAAVGGPWTPGAGGRKVAAIGGVTRRPSRSETSMRTRLQRLALSTVLLASSLLAVAAPAQAAGPAKAAGGQVDGTALYQVGDEPCGPPPAGYEDFKSYPALVMEGDLDGCLYTLALESKGSFIDGVYVELGREVFVGSLNDGEPGTFETTYRFQAKYAGGAELFGRCQHPIVEGSGTGGFEGATGRLDFKDIIEEPITFVYRGHIRLR